MQPGSRVTTRKKSQKKSQAKKVKAIQSGVELQQQDQSIQTRKQETGEMVNFARVPAQPFDDGP